MHVRLLGPLEVDDVPDSPGPVVPVAGGRLRRLVVRLAWDASRIVSGAELIEAVWDDEIPADVTNALQSLVSRARRALGGPASITQHEHGYRLRVDRDDVDAHAFTDAARRGHEAVLAGRLGQAVTVLSDALSCWRGEALVDAGAAPYAVTARRRLDEQRLEAHADRADALLRSGHAAELVAELESLVSSHPLRERFVGQLMTALAAAGRPAEALATYEQLRTFLADELGTDPSAEVQAVHLAVLRGEISVDDIERADPADGTAPAPARTNLRTSVSSFVGRADEVDRVDDLLERGRLTTLVGPGGAGKTRLANEIASHWVSRVADGVWFVELAPVTEPDGVEQAVLSALGNRISQLLKRSADRYGTDSTDRLFAALAEADVLLVIDNCEHVIAATAQLVDDLLARCPRIRVLATSREPLNIAGEALCAVPPLRLPEADATPTEALASPSVQLFAERAAAASAGFVVDDSAVGAVVEIVRRLDGLPLAIELAAARLRVLPVGTIAARIDDRFRLLTGGSRTAMPRHRTLRAVVEWSWDLLEENERTLARRLAVFPAGATSASARAVCPELTEIEVDDVLDALADKSLLHVVASADGEGGNGVRFRMLETIREYGIERLEERGELVTVRTAHARFFAGLTAELKPRLHAHGQLEALARLRADHENILAALRFLGDSGDVDAMLALAVDLSWFWTIVGAHSEAATWQSFALEASADRDTPRRRLVAGLTAIESLQVDRSASKASWESLRAEMAESATRLDEVAGRFDPADAALADAMRAMLAFFAGDVAQGLRVIEATLQDPDPWRRATALIMRASMDENMGNVGRMRSDVTEAVAVFTELGDRWGLSSALAMQAYLRSLDGDDLGAIEDVQEAMRIAKVLDSAEDAAMLNVRLIDLYTRVGDTAGADAAIAAVRSGASNNALAREGAMFADVAEAAMSAFRGDLVAARTLSDRLRSQLDSTDLASPLGGHLLAIVLATTAGIAVLNGDLDLAERDVQRAFPAAVATSDVPIMVTVGVSVAALLHARGEPVRAARALGAAALLRGSADWNDNWVRQLAGTLRAVLGEDAFAVAYADGERLDRDEAIEALRP